MDSATLTQLLGPYGLTVGLLIVNIGLVRAVIYLHQKREDDRQAMQDLVRELHQYHMEASKLVGRNVAVLETMERAHRDD